MIDGTSGRGILLVEDEALIALSEKRILEGFGYAVETATSGEEAVAKASDRKSGIGLVLMDIDLGEGIDGAEAAKMILERRRLPIVFLSSHSERAIVEKLRGVTRYGYVVKNSGDFVLKSSVEMAFELFEAHEGARAVEARLITLVESIPDLVWLKDAEGKYLAGNKVFGRFIGAHGAQLIGKTDYDFHSREAAEFFREKDREAIERGGPNMNEEWVSFADDGHRALLETIKTPIFDDAGRFVGVLGIGRDITERKMHEEKLEESEGRARRALEAVVSPGEDIGELGLAEIIDLGTLRALIESFSALTGMVVAIVDTSGTILLKTGWHDICTKFHRACEASSAACTESDLFLSESVEPGEYVGYKCKNGLWDIVTPLYIEGRHVANIYTGQFFYDDDFVDEAAFAERARGYGFDEDEYLAALRRVPRISRERIGHLMDFLVDLTGFVSRLSYSNLGLAKATTELRGAEAALSESVRDKEILLKELQHRVKNSLGIVSSLLRLNQDSVSDEASLRAFMEAADRISCVSMLYEKLSESASADSIDLGRYLRDLVGLLSSSYLAEGSSVTVETKMESMECDARKAVSLGLILNELFTNAIKYSGGRGRVGVSLSIRGEEAVLEVSDQGSGYPEGFEAESVRSLGMRIVTLMTQRIDGELELASEGGASATVRFQR